MPGPGGVKTTEPGRKSGKEIRKFIAYTPRECASESWYPVFTCLKTAFVKLLLKCPGSRCTHNFIATFGMKKAVGSPNCFYIFKPYSAYSV